MVRIYGDIWRWKKVGIFRRPCNLRLALSKFGIAQEGSGNPGAHFAFPPRIERKAKHIIIRQSGGIDC